MSRDGRSRGFGYADFSSEEGQKTALGMSESELFGRNLLIKPAENKSFESPRGQKRKSFGDRGGDRGGRRSSFGGSGDASEPSNSLFVGGLSYNATEDDLRDAFGEHGEVVSVRVALDRETGRPRGFAHVEFAELDSAKAAFEALNGADIAGRGIRLDFAQSKGGSRGGDRGGFRGGRDGGRGRGRGGRGGFGGDRGGRGGRGGFGGRGGSGGRGGRGGFTKRSFSPAGRKTTFDD